MNSSAFLFALMVPGRAARSGKSRLADALGIKEHKI